MRIFITATLFMMLLASCIGNSGHPTQQDSSSQIEQQKQNSIREAESKAEAERIKKEQEERAKNASKWQYKSETDPMTDNLIYTATLKSNEQNNIDGTANKMDLVIRYNQKDDVTIVLLGLDHGGRIRQEMPLLETRYDKNDVITGSYIATNPCVACVASYKGSEKVTGNHDWLSNLKTSNTLAVKIELENGSKATYTFDTKKLKWQYNQ